MKAVVAAFNQEKALVGAFSVIVQLVVEPMDRFTALAVMHLLLLVSATGALHWLLHHTNAEVKVSKYHLFPSRVHPVFGSNSGLDMSGQFAFIKVSCKYLYNVK